jgi:hypothetical protein
MSSLEFRLGEIARASGRLTGRHMRNVATVLLDGTPA